MEAKGYSRREFTYFCGVAVAAVNAINSAASDAKATVIGSVSDGGALVTMKSVIGAGRIVDMFSGEQIPRIC